MATEDLLLVSKARLLARTGVAHRRRLDAGLSLREVAESLGISHGTLWNWETGRRAPRGLAAAEWARLLDELERARRAEVAS